MLLAGLRPASPLPAAFIQGDDPLEPPGGCACSVICDYLRRCPQYLPGGTTPGTAGPGFARRGAGATALVGAGWSCDALLTLGYEVLPGQSLLVGWAIGVRMAGGIVGNLA
jgi:hypothetical protein